MAVYPSNIPTTSDLPDAGADLSSNPHSALHDDVRDEVIAIAGELGVSPSGTASTVRDRLDDGLGLRQIVTFTSNGTFTKATYPWLRAVRIRVQAGGGGGGGCEATGAGESAEAGGGGGGGYREEFIAASALSASETVTVGSGGAGGTGNAAGSAGGSSAFGSKSVNGGAGGAAGAASASTAFSARGSGGTYTLIQAPSRRGDDGGHGVIVTGGSTVGFNNYGGGTAFASIIQTGASSNVAGTANPGEGGGGSGARNRQASQPANNGGAGGAGIVIVELYA